MLLMCCYLESLICLHFLMAATGINKGACHFDVASSPFKCHFGACFDMAEQYFEEVHLDLKKR